MEEDESQVDTLVADFEGAEFPQCDHTQLIENHNLLMHLQAVMMMKDMEIQILAWRRKLMLRFK